MSVEAMDARLYNHCEPVDATVSVDLPGFLRNAEIMIKDALEIKIDYAFRTAGIWTSSGRSDLLLTVAAIQTSTRKGPMDAVLLSLTFQEPTVDDDGNRFGGYRLGRPRVRSFLGWRNKQARYGQGARYRHRRVRGQVPEGERRRLPPTPSEGLGAQAQDRGCGHPPGPPRERSGTPGSRARSDQCRVAEHRRLALHDRAATEMGLDIGGMRRNRREHRLAQTRSRLRSVPCPSPRAFPQESLARSIRGSSKVFKRTIPAARPAAAGQSVRQGAEQASLDQRNDHTGSDPSSRAAGPRLKGRFMLRGDRPTGH